MSALRLVTPELIEPVNLMAGIAQLELGGPRPGLTVDVGNGNLARANGHLGQAGLLQRLMGHRLLAALAHDPACENVQLPERKLEVDPDIAVLLDLARPAD